MIQIDPKRSSQWMTEFHKQLVRGKQVLLYGNIADLFLLNGEYLSLLQFVERYFREEGYEIIGQYDIVLTVGGPFFYFSGEMGPSVEMTNL